MKPDQSTVVVVTGGASGLGAAVAKNMAAIAAKVCLFDLNADKGEKLARAIGGSTHTVDVSDASSVQSAVAQVMEKHGRIDVLANCAGIAPAGKTVSRGQPHDPELFAKTIAVNLIGSFNCASKVAAAMSQNDPRTQDGERGVIVNTASIAAFDGQVGQVAYAASKGGIVGMTLPMARDLAAHGIRVCTIAPGIFRTPMLEGLPEEVQHSLGQQVPFPSRLGEPEEFASLVRHVVENEMLNGEVIRLDGAIRMAPR